METAAHIVEWWLRPWARGQSPLSERAVRILALAATLCGTVLPAMMAAYGLDGWLWPVTFAVVTCGPVGMILADEGFERIDRAVGLRMSAGVRLILLFVGLSFGVLLGYVVAEP